jgi:transposase InsO family protein
MLDYYSQFVFAQPVACADQATTMAMLLNTVGPVVGWPKTIYSDNGSHFVGAEMQKMLKEHGVLHFGAAISHPSSVGLAERYVRMIIGNVRLQCLQAGRLAALTSGRIMC